MNNSTMGKRGAHRESVEESRVVQSDIFNRPCSQPFNLYPRMFNRYAKCESKMSDGSKILKDGCNARQISIFSIYEIQFWGRCKFQSYTERQLSLSNDWRSENQNQNQYYSERSETVSFVNKRPSRSISFLRNFQVIAHFAIDLIVELHILVKHNNLSKKLDMEQLS